MTSPQLLECLHRLEQRRDVDRDLARDAVVGFGPAREQQWREHVVGVLGAAHDVVADGVFPVAMPRLQDAFEHAERAAPERVELHLDAGVALDGLHQQVVALGGRAHHPVRIVETLRDHAMVDFRVLAKIECRQVEAEGLHAANEALHVAPAGVKSLVRLEARGDQLEIAQELLRVFVSVRPAVVGEAQSLGDLAQEHAIRHAVVAHGRDAERARNQRGVLLDALGEIGIDRAAARALREQLREHATLAVIRVDDDLLLARERFADGLRVDVGIAVHVAAHPGAEADHVRQLERVRRHVVELGERLGELVVERRQDAVEDFGEIEHHVLALVGDREPLARVVFGLPGRGDLGAHAAPVLAQLLRRERRIEPVEQQLRRCAGSCAASCGARSRWDAP